MKGSVAILGASRRRSKFGNKSLRAHLAAGYEVFPVNPKSGAVEGLPCFATLADLPAPPDRISIYLPPERTRRHLQEIAAVGASEVWFNPGTATAEILERARALGIAVRDGCSIIDLGMTPVDFP